MSDITAEKTLDVARTIMEEAEFCVLVTLSESGTAHARPMQPFGPQEDFTLWFGASPTSRKVEELREDARATVCFQEPGKGAYVTLLGEGWVVEDPELRKEHWRPSFERFWPKGPEGDDYVLIRFVPYRLEAMHMADGIAPEPFGLKPAVVTRRDDEWVLTGEGG